MRAWFESLAPREQRMVAIGSVVVVVLLIWGLVIAPLGSATDATRSRVESKRSLLSFIQAASGELAAAGDMPVQPDLSAESLVVVVDRSLRQAGLGRSLTRNQPMGEDGIRLRLENAQFDVLARWLADIHARSGMAIESAAFDRSQDTGLVNASLVLRQTLR
jgi:general secretion pathway protein M